jgi:hypothetical protein
VKYASLVYAYKISTTSNAELLSIGMEIDYSQFQLTAAPFPHSDLLGLVCVGLVELCHAHLMSPLLRVVVLVLKNRRRKEIIFFQRPPESGFATIRF